ncbi:MAG: hypothetical protein AAGC46_15640, partial [Solirubrobacteraceae bacterium]|nr:hypothetical protein [Patulibacter sp.]
MLLRSLGLGLAVYGAGAVKSTDAVEAAINDALGEHKVIVSVFVDGGWDGLSLLTPLGSDSRHQARLKALRPTLSSLTPASQLLPFGADPSLSWHPAAAGLRDLWDDPSVGVAVAPSVGYGSPNYSHFTSRHFWEVGALDVGGTTGWMGRYLDRVGRPDVPLQGVSMGDALSPTLATSSAAVAAIYDMDTFGHTFSGGAGALAAAATQELRALGLTPSGDVQRDQSRIVTDMAFDLAADLAPAVAVEQPMTAYPTTPSYFVDSLKDTARLLSARSSGSALPVRCVALKAHGAFDTHSRQ